MMIRNGILKEKIEERREGGKAKMTRRRKTSKISLLSCRGN